MTSPAATVTRIRPADAGRARFNEAVTYYMTHLAAERKSPHTIRSYRNALTLWAEFFEATDRDLDPRAATRRDMDAFMVWLIERGAKPATQSGRFVIVRLFFEWMADPDENLIERNPFRAMKGPKVPDTLIPTIPVESLEALRRVTAGRSFADRRDRAIIMLLLSTGMRRSEVMSLMLEDVDHARGLIRVHGATSKGERDRDVQFYGPTSDDLRRYLMARAEHPFADDVVTVGERRDNQRTGHPLWLPLIGHGHVSAKSTGNMLYQMLARRCAEAGIPMVHPHQFRHTWTDEQQAAGTADGEIMVRGGWKTRAMLDRYGRANAARRAEVNYTDPAERMLSRAKRL